VFVPNPHQNVGIKKITEENTGQRRTKRINDSQGEGVPSPKLHNN
jgi:hypothetical protein